MIRTLLRVLGDEYARAMRRTVILMTITAVVEGLSYALLVPVLRALLGSTPADAVPWLVAFGAAVALYAVLRYVSDLSGMRVGTTMLRGMYHRLGEHLARLPLGWYDAGRIGEVSVLAGRGLLQAMGVAAHLLAPFISALVTPLTIVAVMAAFNWRMGLAALLAAPVVAAIQAWTARATAAADAERHERDQEASGRVIEFLQAQPVLRAGGRTGERFRLLDDSLLDAQRASRRTVLSTLPSAVGLTLTVQAMLHRAAGPGRLPRARREHRRGGDPGDPGARRPLRRSAAVAVGHRRQTPRRAFGAGQTRDGAAHRAAARNLASRSSRRTTAWSSTPSPSGTASARCSTRCRCRPGGTAARGRRAVRRG